MSRQPIEKHLHLCMNLALILVFLNLVAFIVVVANVEPVCCFSGATFVFRKSSTVLLLNRRLFESISQVL